MQYNEFLNFIFQRNTKIDNEWFYRDEDANEVISNIEIINYSKKIFKDIDSILDTYADIQICHGLWYLVDPASSFSSYAYFDIDIEESERISCIKDMLIVFQRLFKRKCSAHLSYLQIDKNSKEYDNESIFNFFCYMWWDVFPRHGVPYSKSLAKIDKVILHLLEEILSIDNIACIESALHGLGHWHAGYPEVVVDIIDKNFAIIPKELIEYAELARDGRM